MFGNTFGVACNTCHPWNKSKLYIPSTAKEYQAQIRAKSTDRRSITNQKTAVFDPRTRANSCISSPSSESAEVRRCRQTMVLFVMGWVLRERVQRTKINPKIRRDSVITPSQLPTTSASKPKAGYAHAQETTRRDW